MQPERQWSGFVYDGRTADRQHATVSLEPDGLRVRYGAVSQLWPVTEVRQTQGSFSSEMLRLEYGSDPVHALFVEQPGFSQALKDRYRGLNPTMRGTRNTSRMIAVFAGVAASVVLLYLFGAPRAATWLTRRTPPEWDRALGNGLAERLASSDRQCTDSAGLAAVRSVLDRLVAAGPSTAYDFRVAVLRDSSINAFAAPGGFVAVNSGLLRAAKSPEELAGVLAHEIQHVVQRHSTRAIIREAPARMALSLIFSGSGVESVAGLANSLGALSYRRDDEEEADVEGMRLLQAAGIDGNAMVSFMNTLAHEDGEMRGLASYLSTHPQGEKRIANLRGLVQQGSATIPLMDSSTWVRVKTMCEAPPTRVL